MTMCACSLNELSSTRKSQFHRPCIKQPIFNHDFLYVQVLSKFAAQQSAMLVLASFWPDLDGTTSGRKLTSAKQFNQFSAIVSHDYSVTLLALNNIFCPKKLSIQRVYLVVARFDQRQQN